jgi:hypothetical protein
MHCDKAERCFGLKRISDDTDTTDYLRDFAKQMD